MCQGVSIDWREFLDWHIERYRLAWRSLTRMEQAEREYLFLYKQHPRELPVWCDGELIIAEWGAKNRATRLPSSGWCPQEVLESGVWGEWRPLLGEIPAMYAYDGNVWFQVPKGIRAVVLCDQKNGKHVYVLTQPSTHYYEVMTRQDRMPVFIGEQI